MKILYEDSPRKFEELLATLLKTDTYVIVGPTFTQQKKTVKSIPDLAITQKYKSNATLLRHIRTFETT